MAHLLQKVVRRHGRLMDARRGRQPHCTGARWASGYIQDHMARTTHPTRTTCLQQQDATQWANQQGRPSAPMRERYAQYR